MLRVHKEQYDLIVLNKELVEIYRAIYKKYIRESWPLIRFNKDD